MAETYFTGDFHIGHLNCIRFDSRPFSSIEEHDQGLIDNYNSIVSDKDTVYILGDSVLRKEFIPRLKQLKGHIKYITGNHDRKFIKDYYKYFDSVLDYMEIKIDKIHINLSHYAFEVWNKGHYGSFMLHAHSHSKLDVRNKELIEKGFYRWDVGVVTNDYFPISFEELKDKFYRAQA